MQDVYSARRKVLNMKNKRGQLLLELVVIFFWASEYCHSPYFTPYLESLEIAATVVGAIVACYGFTQMVIRIPLGIATDATGAYKTVIQLGLLCTTVSSLGLYLSANVAIIFLCRVLAGAAASTWIAMTVAYMDFFTPEESVKSTARLNAFNNAGKLLAFVLGGVAAVTMGYRVTLFMSFAVGMIGLVLSVFLEKVETRRAPLSWRKLGQMLTRRSVMLPALLMAVQQMVMHSTVFSFTSSFAKDAGATDGMLSALSVVFTVVQIPAAKVIASPAISKAPRNRAISGGLFLLGGYLVLLAVAGNVWIMMAGQAAAAFGAAMLNSILLAECVKEAGPGERSTIVGIYQAVYGIGMTLGPAWMGWLMEHTGRGLSCGVFAAFVFLTGLLVFCCWGTGKQRKKV